jgi:hypothetical protein
MVKVDSAWHRVAHGKCVGLDSGVDKDEIIIVNAGIGSHTPCFSLDSASAVTLWHRVEVRGDI